MAGVAHPRGVFKAVDVESAVGRASGNDKVCGMQDGGQHGSRRAFWVLLAGVTLLRLAVAGLYEFGADEAHYVAFARRLAWGYFDHPPMVAFLGVLSTGFDPFTCSAFLFRLGPIVCWVLSACLLRLLVLRLYADERIAFRALAVLCLVPMQQLLGVALLPDAPLAVFWCATLLCCWRAMEDGGRLWWPAAGACCGAALLSKYHGALLPLLVGGYIVASRSRRALLRTAGPYVAGAVALLAFSPNILWNARNGWVSYLYQLGHGGGSGEFRWSKVGVTLGGQFAAGSPVLVGLLLAGAFWLVRRLRRGSGGAAPADAFVLWTSLPVFALFCGVGFVGKILPHWTAVGWWMGAVLVARVTIAVADEAGDSSGRWHGWFRAGVVSSLAIIALMATAIAFPLVGTVHESLRPVSAALNRRFPSIRPMKPFNPRHDLANDLFGWRDAAAAAEALRAAMPQPGRTFVFAHHFLTASRLLAYLPRTTETTSLRPQRGQYGLWFRWPEHKGWDAVFADENRVGPGRYAHLFERVEAVPDPLVSMRRGQPVREFRFYRCYGFRGSETP